MPEAGHLAMAVILGISSYLCDSAAALLVQGKLTSVVEEERFERVKHTKSFPVGAIRYCLDEQGLSLSDVDYFAIHFDPRLSIVGRIPFMLRFFPQSLLHLRSKQGQAVLNMLRLRHEVAERMGVSERSLKHCKFVYVNHHLSHACSTFLTSPFDEAAIMTLDGGGEIATSAFHRGIGRRVETFWTHNAPDSLGFLYSTLTKYLGFKPECDEGKVMGLAPYGEPRYLREFEKLIQYDDQGTFRLDMSYFTFQFGGDRWYSPKLVALLGPPRAPESELTQHAKDVAATLQHVLEQVAVRLARRLHREFPSKNLCLAGGVALNSVMNGKIFEQTPFENVFIMPAASDAGTSLGNVLYVHNMLLERARCAPLDNAYWGPSFKDEEVLAALEAERENVSWVRHPDPAAEAARLLSENKILGWFQGRMEFGPRALGNRSILANPTHPDMKDIVNARVKFREAFRPFAPSATLERAHDYFEFSCETPYMLLVVPVRPGFRERLPAITHVDGTARLQTVTEAQNPRYYRLIRELGKRTGIECVLNTSFNVRGQPIVNTPAEAVTCLLKTGLDHLIIHDFVVSKQSAPGSVRAEASVPQVAAASA